MTKEHPLFEKLGYLIALLTFIFTFLFFYIYTDTILWNVIASVINAGIVWGTYIVIRMCYLASR